MKMMKKNAMVCFLCLLCGGRLLAVDLDFSDVARMVIQSGGRKKPLDTFAADTFQTVSGRRNLRDPETGQGIGSMDALCSIWFRARDWKNFPAILVSNAALRREIGLSATERLFSLTTLLKNRPLVEFQKTIEAKNSRNEELTSLEKEAEMVITRMALMDQLVRGEAFTLLPDPHSARESWHPLSQAAEVYGNPTAIRLAEDLEKVSEAYVAREPQTFTAASKKLRSELAGLAPADYPAPEVVDREVNYNHWHPFRWAWILYAAAFLILLIPSKNKTQDLRLSPAAMAKGDGTRFGSASGKSGFWIFALGSVAHVDGFILRCLIAGRAPVTNMYESVVWVSLGVSLLAIAFAWIYGARVYLLAAAPLAVAGLILADMLPSVLNPSIGPLPPVLRDNFWLVTHVLTITLGYAAFALAMGMGHIILWKYLFKPESVEEKSSLHHLLYRMVQLGVLLLGAGTVLGGVWANDAWGRFWGWDPKETWALIALLLYIFGIHGRIAGWWQNFGMSISAVLCFNGVLMAWYGVNFVLGKGLHSYGFGGGGGGWIGTLVGIDLVFVGLCLVRRVRQTRQVRRPAC